MPVRTLLDTNVLITAFRGQGEAQERAMSLIADANREFVTSDFSKLELLPKPMYFGRAEELQFYQHYLALAVDNVQITPERTQGAFELAARYGLSGPDALQVEAARAAGVLELITSESATKPIFRVDEGELAILPLLEEANP